MNETAARIRTLFLLSSRLNDLTSLPTYQPPFGREEKDITRQLEAMCDEVERLLWKLGGSTHANP